MATQAARALLTKCHFIRSDCLSWPLKKLAWFWPNVTSSGQIVCYGHSNSSHSSDQMSLHQARLSLMATQRAHTLLTKCHFIRPDCYGCSNSLYSSDQMSLHWSRLSVRATQTASALLTKCHFIRPDCLSWPLTKLVWFWPNVTSLGQIVSYGHWKSLLSTHFRPNVTPSGHIVMALTELAPFWPNVTSPGKIVCHGHSKSLHFSDQMLLH